MCFSSTFFMIIWLLHLDTCCQTEQKTVCIVTLVIIYIQNFSIYYVNTMDTSFNLHPSISIWWLEVPGILLVEKWPVFYIYSHFNLPIFISLSVSSCNKNNTHLKCTTAGNHLFCGFYTLQIHDHKMIKQVNLSWTDSGTKTTHTMFYCLEKQLQYVKLSTLVFLVITLQWLLYDANASTL